MEKIYNKDGFVWWVGVVEDRMDPLKMGRCRVRIFGYHGDDKTLLPTEDLPWAIPVQPIISAAMSGVGITPVGVLPGTWVIGFFLDGNDGQQPAMFGTIGTYAAKTFAEPAEVPAVQNTNDGTLKDGSGNVVTDGSGNPVRSGNPPTPGWELGKTSEKYETGGKGPGTINNYAASNDLGGASYGTYQFASYLPAIKPDGKARPSAKNSPVMAYLANSKFKQHFDGLEPATAAFDSKWKEIAATYPTEFKADQHTYTQAKYYDIMIANLKRKGLDLTSFGPAVQDLVWSTAVQFGPGKTSIFLDPLDGKSQLTDKDIVAIVSEYKISNVANFFKSSGASIIAGVKARYESEKSDLIKLITV